MPCLSINIFDQSDTGASHQTVLDGEFRFDPKMIISKSSNNGDIFTQFGECVVFSGTFHTSTRKRKLTWLDQHKVLLPSLLLVNQRT